MTLQVSTHRRGGTHRVRDEDRTNSVYDVYNHRELMNATKERGLYRKDMKKVEMATALRDDDERKSRLAYIAGIEQQRREQRRKKEQKRKADERRRLTVATEKTRKNLKGNDRASSVSSDTLSGIIIDEDHDRFSCLNEFATKHIGQALSDVSWDSTSTESTRRSVSSPIFPDCRLRLFEWPYAQMPQSCQPSFIAHPSTLDESAIYTCILWKLPYAPLKVVTTISKESLFLPGQNYPQDIDPAYVPILPFQTRNAARNGVLEGMLCKAVIEKATDWAERTLIQGWNARMYFSAPSSNEGKDLAQVYRKWYLKNRMLHRVKGNGSCSLTDRETRHLQHSRNKGKKAAEVYEACKHRLTAVCYLPVYLDYDVGSKNMGQEESETEYSLTNLFFIRFPHCNVPHYYFWTSTGDWKDPTIPNMAWSQESVTKMAVHPQPVHNSHGAHRNRARNTRIHVSKRYVREKKPHPTPKLPYSPSAEENLDQKISSIEDELYNHGLRRTLSRCRTKWIADGKEHSWKIFARSLPNIYPSGQLPNVPPVDTHSGLSVALKLAVIDNLGKDEQTPLSPFGGDEAWTRDDDSCWSVVLVDDEEVDGEEDSDDEHYRKLHC